jgi:anti-sigma B factor antagonist
VRATDPSTPATLAAAPRSHPALGRPTMTAPRRRFWRAPRRHRLGLRSELRPPLAKRVYRDGGVRVSRPASIGVRAGPEEIKASQPPPASRSAGLVAGRSGGPVTTHRLPERGRDGPLGWPALQALPGDAENAPARSVEGLARGLPSELLITCQELEDLVLVRLRGELDVYTSQTFREHVRRYDPAEVQLAIDLAGVRLLDSAGLGGLISLRNHAHRGGARLGLVCPRRELARLFWATGLRSAFVFGESLAALRAGLADTTTRPARSS